MTTRATILSLLATVFLLPLTCLAQASQNQTGQPQIDRPLVNPITTTLSGIFVPSNMVQIDPTTQTVVPDTCRFSLSLAPGQKAIEAHRVSEISVDAANNTCAAQFEVGQPAEIAELTPAESANLANTSENSLSAVPVRTGAGKPLAHQPGGALALATVQSAGFLKTWWVDPINITVNSDQNSTTWRWSGAGNCVTGILGGENLTWFTGSGWFLASDSWQNTFNCSATTSASTTHYQNNIFCAFFTTFATYNPNKVNGLQNGTLQGTWNDTVSGNVCVNLLSFRMQLTRTQN